MTRSSPSSGTAPALRATIEKDPAKTTEEGLLEVYRKLRPGEPPTVESAQTHLRPDPSG